jgi:hypothetical protein
MEKNIDAILKKIKMYFPSYPEACVGIMNSLGNALTTVESFKELISFLGGVISSEPNSKKKLNFLKMTEGTIDALKRFSKDKANAESANEVAN